MLHWETQCVKSSQLQGSFELAVGDAQAGIMEEMKSNKQNCVLGYRDLVLSFKKKILSRRCLTLCTQNFNLASAFSV